MNTGHTQFDTIKLSCVHLRLSTSRHSAVTPISHIATSSAIFAPIACVLQGHVGLYWRGGKLLSWVTPPGMHMRMPFIDVYEPIQVGSSGRGRLPGCHSTSGTAVACAVPQPLLLWCCLMLLQAAGVDDAPVLRWPRHAAAALLTAGWQGKERQVIKAYACVRTMLESNMSHVLQRCCC
jgi:hypothetical protein